MLTSTLRESINWWEVVLAIVFIFTVLYFKWGLLGQIEPHLQRWLSRQDAPLKPAPARVARHFGTFKLEAVNMQAGQVKILNDLSFEVNKAGIFCLIGPNGAGKTTTFNASRERCQSRLARLVYCRRDGSPKCNTASTTWDGAQISAARVFETLTVGENLSLALDCTPPRTWSY